MNMVIVGKRNFERVQGSRAAEMAASLLLKKLGRMIYENQRRLPVQDIGKLSHCEGDPGVKEKVVTGLGKTKAMSKKDGEKREGNMGASECREDQQRRVYATRWSYVTYPSYLNCPMATAPISHRSNLSLLDAMPRVADNLQCLLRSAMNPSHTQVPLLFENSPQLLLENLKEPLCSSDKLASNIIPSSVMGGIVDDDVASRLLYKAPETSPIREFQSERVNTLTTSSSHVTAAGASKRITEEYYYEVFDGRSFDYQRLQRV